MNRHEQRRRYFFDALLRVNDGSLRGLRVLDLGCRAGHWSMQAIEAGAEFVCGIDRHEIDVEQARLAFQTQDVERSRYRFEAADVFEHDFGEERFDVALCLGLMHRVGKPVELFEVFDRVGAELLVIDTAVSMAPSGHFELDVDGGSEGRHSSAGRDVALVPTRGALIELASEFGYEAVPLAHDMSDDVSVSDYRAGRRLAFLCARTRSLAALPREQPPAAESWWNVLLDPARRGWQRARS